MSDGPIRPEFDRLADAYDRFDTFSGDEAPPGSGATGDHEPASVGPYRIIRKIGQGGMGAVYLAVRHDDEYKKRVAIKLLRPDVNSDGLVRRFRHERQMLAAIDHPFIAKLLDGGSVAGSPYLVMEYIEGRPVDVYCDEHRLSIAERLRLFRKICAAVHFAHQNLIVHRDLKPGNVLVTSDGTPKLVDFGIAKPLNPDMFAGTVGVTAADSQLMTPEYASPEQISGGAITTATDVYSLGVILYGLLTGHHPYELTGLPLHEVARIICETQPLRPSAVVGIDSEAIDGSGLRRKVTSETVSRARQATPDKLRRRLRGDLENIVLMAMRKEPQRRYASVEQFSDDIRRYEEGLPVRAQRPTWSYRTSRFARRHKSGLAIAASIVLLLAGFAVVTARERQRAVWEAQRARAVLGFLSDALSASDPRVAQGHEPTVREMLDDAERQLAGDHGLPAAEASVVRRIVAESRLHRGQLQQARQHYLALMQSAGDQGAPSAADAVASLSGLAATEAELGMFKDAEAHAREAVERVPELPPGEARTAVRALNTLADVLLRSGSRERVAEAAALLGRAGDLAESGLDRSSVERQATAHLLVQTRLAQNRPREAEPVARANFDFALAALGPRHPHTLDTLDVLSACLFELSRFQELLQVQEDYVERARRVLGAEHPVTLRAQHTVAATLRALDRFAESRALFERVLADKTRILGPSHPSTLSTRHNMALLVKDMGDAKAAERLLREVVDERRRVLGPLDPETLGSEMMVALTLYEQRRLEDSRDAYADVLPRIKESAGESSASYLVGSVNYAGLLYRLGDYTAAERALHEVLAVYLRDVGEQFVGTHYTRMELGTTLVHQKRYEEAERLLLDALSGFKELFKEQPRHRRIGHALDRLAKLYAAWGKGDKASEYARLLKEATAAEVQTVR